LKSWLPLDILLCEATYHVGGFYHRCKRTVVDSFPVPYTLGAFLKNKIENDFYKPVELHK